MKLNHGHLLTSHFYDTARGMEISFFGRDENGPFKLVFPNQKVVFFIAAETKFSPNEIQFERKKSNLKSFNHKLVDTIYLNKYSDLQKAKDYCQINGVRSYEVDILPTERFLMERFIHSQVEFQGEFIQENGLRIFTNPEIRKGHSKIEFSNLSLDIETGVKGELYSIGLHYKYQNEMKNLVLMLADTDEKISDELLYYSHEKSLCEAFLKLMQDWDPDFLIGWHVIGFDLAFLEKKCLQFGLQLNIGRSNSKCQINEKKGMGFFADMPGRVVLDGPPTLRSAFYKYKNFKLETVASEVLGTGKDIASDAGKVSEIERRFKEDKMALAKYNLLDCKLVTDIYEKLDIFNFVIARTKISGLLFDRINISTAAFDHIFLPKLHRNGYVAPNRMDIERDDASTGGMVIEPVIGLHENVSIFDFKSLYPTIMMTFGIDPYALVMAEVNPNIIKTPKGYSFSKDHNLLTGIISQLMEIRQAAKNNKDHSLSQAVKILMNSFYGIMGSSRCRFYHADLPSAITTTGHWILTQAIDFFKIRGYEVLYGDTDSIFIKTGNHNQKDNEKLAKDLDDYLRTLILQEFKISSRLECEYEKTFSKLFFSQMRGGEGGAKKRYAGISNRELEFKGMEVVRSDWTELAKNFQYELYDKFFSGEELESFIKSYIKRLESGEFDEYLIYTKKLSKDPKEYTKNIPIHVKAALQIDHTGPYRLKEVSYVICKDGPIPIQNEFKNLDYNHYIEKQLKPIANDILHYQNKSFDSFIVGDQLSFF